MRALTFASHLVYLDDMAGCGLLILPHPSTDVPSPASLSASLHAAEWDDIMRLLDQQGWEPLDDGKGMPMVDGETADGRDVVTLYGRERIIAEPTLEQQEESLSELRRLAGSVATTT